MDRERKGMEGWGKVTTTPLVVFQVMNIQCALCVQSARCCYVILVMSVYWATEVIPMSITALIPIAAMPWLGVASSRQICPNYFDVSSN